MHLNKHILQSQQLKKYLTSEANFFFFFFIHWNLHVDTKNFKKISQKVYGYLDNLI